MNQTIEDFIMAKLEILQNEGIIYTEDIRQFYVLCPNSMSAPFFISNGYVLTGEIAHQNNHYY